MIVIVHKVLADDKHILEKPITLSCGHSLCRECIPSDLILTCRICEIEIIFDLTKANESDMIFKKLLSMKFSQVFQLINLENINNNISW
jgi:hypothetical protein